MRRRSGVHLSPGYTASYGDAGTRAPARGRALLLPTRAHARSDRGVPGRASASRAAVTSAVGPEVDGSEHVACLDDIALYAGVTADGAGDVVALPDDLGGLGGPFRECLVEVGIGAGPVDQKGRDLGRGRWRRALYCGEFSGGRAEAAAYEGGQRRPGALPDFSCDSAGECRYERGDEAGSIEFLL